MKSAKCLELAFVLTSCNINTFILFNQMAKTKKYEQGNFCNRKAITLAQYWKEFVPSMKTVLLFNTRCFFSFLLLNTSVCCCFLGHIIPRKWLWNEQGMISEVSCCWVSTAPFRGEALSIVPPCKVYNTEAVTLPHMKRKESKKRWIWAQSVQTVRVSTQKENEGLIKSNSLIFPTALVGKCFLVTYLTHYCQNLLEVK